MLGIILASHGDLVYGLRDTYSMVAGDLPENIKIISLRRDSDADTFKKEFHELVNGFRDISGLVVLTDLEGGTPYNTACTYFYDPEFKTETEVISGVNFPMLLEALESSESGLNAAGAAENIMNTARESIKKAGAVLEEEDEF